MPENPPEGVLLPPKKWSALNIVIIVVSLLIFWPLGLFLLVWIAMGRTLREIPDWTRLQFERLRFWIGSKGYTGNRVFDEYQQTQQDRIDELRAEIRNRRKAFQEYKDRKDRDAEQGEFDDFMRQGPGVPEA